MTRAHAWLADGFPESATLALIGRRLRAGLIALTFRPSLCNAFSYLGRILLIYRCYNFAVANQKSTNTTWRMKPPWFRLAGCATENAHETLEP